ncbi:MULTISPECIES: hypothetical protein [unclassified Microbacterium]|uniref:hypothetical protein n=1 Tax=unclassified Microbacterium TaxID=2609290 RepID=UPI00109CCCEC|nr:MULTISPECIES: hypothetical protein [unclassified Microbacterium]
MAFGVVVLVPPTLMVSYLIGSLIFSGGQVGEAKDPMWDVVFPYPLFVVPTTPLVIIGLLAVIFAIAVAVTTRASDVPGVRRLIGPTVAAAVCAFGWALATPEDPTRFNNGFIGTQWTTSFYFLVALGVLLLGIVAARARARSRESARG